MYCKNCGAQIEDGISICPSCGKRTSESSEAAHSAPQPIVVNVNNTNANSNINSNAGNYPYKSKTTAALLCFFLGGLGIHRFYVGKTGSGILFLLTAGFCGVGTLIDFFRILFNGFTDKAGYPLK